MVCGRSCPFCAHNSPSVSSIGTMVPEQHTGMASALKHLKSHKAPPSTNVLFGLSIPPAVQAIIVNRVFVVNPQLAPIIRKQAEVVTACLEDPQTTCPAHSEVITP